MRGCAPRAASGAWPCACRHPLFLGSSISPATPGDGRARPRAPAPRPRSPCTRTHAWHVSSRQWRPHVGMWAPSSSFVTARSCNRSAPACARAWAQARGTGRTGASGSGSRRQRLWRRRQTPSHSGSRPVSRGLWPRRGPLQPRPLPLSHGIQVSRARAAEGSLATGRASSLGPAAGSRRA